MNIRFDASRARKIVGVLLALLAVAAGIVAIVDNGPEHGTVPRRTITVTLGGPGATKVALPPAAQQIAAAQARDDATGNAKAAESDLHDLTPPAAVDAAAAKDIVPAGQPQIPAHVPLAAVSTPGCRTALVRNYSSRRGAPILLGVIHWTGSQPTPESAAGGLAIVRWFDTPASQASSSEITDQAGRCWLTVAESQKPWTQAGFNPWSVSVEIVNQGVQPLFQTAAARAAVIRLMRGWHARWHLPYRRARVSGCRVIRSGFLAHRDLGSCGGGHPDVGAFDLDGLIREASQGASGKPVTPVDRRTCRKLAWWRAHGRPHGLPELRAVRRRRALEHRHVTCTARGPVHRG